MPYKPKDRYFNRAKQEGYRSRAAYKLIELQQRYRLMKPGDAVVDLGAAPGGWLQVAAKTVGPRGKVVGVDLQPIEPVGRAVYCIQGDIASEEVQRHVRDLLGGAADVLLSDLAPRLSGIRDADSARCLELNRAAQAAAGRLLRPGGALLVKSFINAELQTFTAELRACFSAVQRTRPDATRQGSSEFYFVASGFRPGLPAERISG